MRIAVVGGGGREHALVHALRRSAGRPEVLSVGANPGIEAEAPGLPGADAGAPAQLAAAFVRAGVDLVVVGPEAPLVDGLVDACAREGVRCFGPVAAAARLEGSKAFAKEVMEAAGVPTAGAAVVTEVQAGLDAITRYPVVLKADGLAAGKGVAIVGDEASARAWLVDVLEDGRFGSGGEAVVLVEEHLVGDEVSLLALCDGERALALAPARDFKRIGDGDTGPNTGGMGAFSPVPGLDERTQELSALVHQPILDALARRGTPFHGVLYAGVMLTADGPRVLEYNVRFGDPETQAVLPRLRSDLADLLARACDRGGLDGATLEWDDRATVTVVLASRGYPESSSSGDVITGLDAVPAGAAVTHAGTARDAEGRWVTAGGRVLNVTASGDDVTSARAAAYAAADVIDFSGKQVRRDIAAGIA